MADKKYISKIVRGSDTLYIKDAEAQAMLSGLTGAMHYIGITTTSLTDGSTTNPIQIDGQSVTAKAGDVVVVAGSGTGAGADKEFVFNGTKWQEFGSTGSLKALAFKDNATGSYTPIGTNSSSEVSFNSATTTTQFVTAYKSNTGSFPTLASGTSQTVVTGISAGELPSLTSSETTCVTEIGNGSFPTVNSGSSAFVKTIDVGTLPTLGSAQTSNFNTDAEKTFYNESEETLTFSAATTATAVIAQGAFDQGTLPEVTTGTTVTSVSLTGGSFPTVTTGKTINTISFSKGSFPTASGTKDIATSWSLNGGSFPELNTTSGLTVDSRGTAAPQTFSGTTGSVTVS